MAKRGQWEILNFVFALKYDFGYRYLDRCGEMMLDLERAYGFIPSETKPIGAKLDNPELGMNLEVSTTEFRISQEVVKDDGELICQYATSLTKAILPYLEDAIPFYAGFMRSSFLSFETEDALHNATLTPDGASHFELANELDMVRQSQSLCHTFTSGSYELEFNLKEVTLHSPSRRTFSAGFKPNERAKTVAARRNAAVSSIPPAPEASFAMLMELDLRERAPTIDGYQNQIRLLQFYANKLQTRYSGR